jgi:hypothetical protein
MSLGDFDDRYVIMVRRRIACASPPMAAAAAEWMIGLRADLTGVLQDMDSAPRNWKPSPPAFRGMTRYPYPPTERAPDAATVDHARYNTRARIPLICPRYGQYVRGKPPNSCL